MSKQSKAARRSDRDVNVDVELDLCSLLGVQVEIMLDPHVCCREPCGEDAPACSKTGDDEQTVMTVDNNTTRGWWRDGVCVCVCVCVGVVGQL